MKHVGLASSFLFLSGCATISFTPSGPYATTTPISASTGNAVGQRVLWGGILVATRPEARQTCFEVLGIPLNQDHEPRYERTRTEGRFIACSPGFYDPALYAAGREITLAGDITSIESHQIGHYMYRFPVLKAGQPHLWPRPLPVRYFPVCWGNPFCSPWGWSGFYPYPYYPAWR